MNEVEVGEVVGWRVEAGHLETGAISALMNLFLLLLEWKQEQAVTVASRRNSNLAPGERSYGVKAAASRRAEKRVKCTVLRNLP